MIQSKWILVGLSILCVLLGVFLAWYTTNKEGFQQAKTPITVILPTYVDALADIINYKRIKQERNIYSAQQAPKKSTLEYALFYKSSNIDDAMKLILTYYTDEYLFSTFENEASIYMKNNLSTVEDILYTTMYGIPAMIEPNVFPENWSLYALKQTGNNPFTARQFMLKNYTNMDRLVLQEYDPKEYIDINNNIKTWDITQQGGQWDASNRNTANADTIRIRICKELESAARLFKTKLEGLRTAAMDLSGSIHTAMYAKIDNMEKQISAMDSTKTGDKSCNKASPSNDCKRLASIDTYLYELIPDYQKAQDDLFAESVTIQDNIHLLKTVSDMYKCPFFTDLSGFDTTTTTTDPTTGDTVVTSDPFDISEYTGNLQTEELIYSIQALSPYYVSPDITNYITRNIQSERSGSNDPYILTNKSYQKLLDISSNL
jgi:hypothetical protein